MIAKSSRNSKSITGYYPSPRRQSICYFIIHNTRTCTIHRHTHSRNSREQCTQRYAILHRNYVFPATRYVERLCDTRLFSILISTRALWGGCTRCEAFSIEWPITIYYRCILIILGSHCVWLRERERERLSVLLSKWTRIDSEQYSYLRWVDSKLFYSLVQHYFYGRCQC